MARCWIFGEDVLSRLQSRDRDGSVQFVVRADEDGLHVGGKEGFPVRQAFGANSFCEFGTGLRILGRDIGDHRVLVGSEFLGTA